MMTWEDIIKRNCGCGKNPCETYGSVKKNIEEEILDEVKDEGGALGMKNLKEIADKKKLNQTISDMKDKGKLFEHKDGDFYTHKPKR